MQTQTEITPATPAPDQPRVRLRRARMDKGRDGWRAETCYDIGQNHWQIDVTTRKPYRGGVQTTVSVAQRDGVFMTHRVFADYLKTWATSATRCTEKSVREQHAEVLAVFHTLIVGDVETHYQMRKEVI